MYFNKILKPTSVVLVVSAVDFGSGGEDLVPEPTDEAEEEDQGGHPDWRRGREPDGGPGVVAQWGPASAEWRRE
ncbi:hypothetical protein M8J77_009140 [Diaphorina citri]|nr:hypothetical protein M8J77_009140 [Diaphorina citri]